MRVDSGILSGGWGDQTSADSTTTVSLGESTLAQVATRLGISAEALQAANPQIANPNALTAGMELKIPAGSAPELSQKFATQESPADASLSSGSKRMERDFDSLQMKAMLDASPEPSGSGGITQEFPVARFSGEGYTKDEKAEITQALGNVYHKPQFQALNQEERQKFLLTLAGNPPLTQEKISNALDLLSSMKDCSPAARKGALDGLMAAHCDPAYARSLKKLLDDPSFRSLPDAVKIAVTSQAGNYPDPRTVGNIQRMLHKDWFQSQPLDDMQRSLKTIARFSHNPNGDRNIIDNTLDKFLAPDSTFKLEWKSLKSKGGTLYGEADDGVLTLNKDLINAGNGKMVENYRSDRLSLNTVAHEVNHLVNDDKVDNTFDYFNAEYRAWVVGFQAQHGRLPTNEEAMGRIRTQFNHEPYSLSTKGALRNPAEAQKLFDFVKSVTGLDVNAHNVRNIVNNSDPEKDWKTLSVWEAPTGAGNLDNH
jgi:LysM domain